MVNVLMRDATKMFPRKGLQLTAGAKGNTWNGKVSRNALFDKEKMQEKDSKTIFNVTYYPVYRNLKTLLDILACDGEHRKVFPNVSIIGFKKSKNLRWHLVRVAPSTLDKVMPKLCGRKRLPCQLCSSMKDTNSFKSKHFKKVHHRIKLLD